MLGAAIFLIFGVLLFVSDHPVWGTLMLGIAALSFVFS